MKFKVIFKRNGKTFNSIVEANNKLHAARIIRQRKYPIVNNIEEIETLSGIIEKCRTWFPNKKTVSFEVVFDFEVASMPLDRYLTESEGVLKYKFC